MTCTTGGSGHWSPFLRLAVISDVLDDRDLQPKRVQDLNIWVDTIKSLEKNIEETAKVWHRKRHFGKDFRSTGKKQTKTDTWNYIQLRSFCTSKASLDKEASDRRGENLYKLWDS